MCAFGCKIKVISIDEVVPVEKDCPVWEDEGDGVVTDKQWTEDKIAMWLEGKIARLNALADAYDRDADKAKNGTMLGARRMSEQERKRWFDFWAFKANTVRECIEIIREGVEPPTGFRLVKIVNRGELPPREIEENNE